MPTRVDESLHPWRGQQRRKGHQAARFMREEPAGGAVIGETISDEAGVDKVRKEGGGSRWRRRERGEQHRTEVVVIANTVGGAGPPRCHGVGERGGEEPGMRAWGLQVVGRDGAACCAAVPPPCRPLLRFRVAAAPPSCRPPLLHTCATAPRAALCRITVRLHTLHGHREPRCCCVH
uniref:Uncharacterized protein n=1 Tax=Oryza nivara TaxID=4536 RepID=A0A0E0FI61_ORYNI